jgi:glucoamylase
MERQFGIAADALLRCISATDLVCRRRGFGQTIVPARGSVLASRQIAFYDPDPDYFFHWLRDSALILDAVRGLLHDQARRAEAAEKFRDFLRFSVGLTRLSGAQLVQDSDWRKRIDPALLQYVRPDTELRQIEGERTLGETRYNPDGTLDILQWPRPQNDGSALRALCVLRYWSMEQFQDSETRSLMVALLRGDLAHTMKHCSEPCFDTWEEEVGHHYFTRLVQRTALLEGAAWARELGDADSATRYLETARQLSETLDAFWSAQRGHYLSRSGVAAGDANKLLDSATMLAVLHAEVRCGPHSILDPRVHATWLRLEELFLAGYRINSGRRDGLGPAIGRYKGDVYYHGGAWYVTTLAFAALYFRLAHAVRTRSRLLVIEDNRRFLRASGYEGPVSLDPLALDTLQSERLFLGLMARGDAIMATVRRYTPPSGELSEQFDQDSGEQRSAKNLSWSYAAFVTAFVARQQACGSKRP